MEGDRAIGARGESPRFISSGGSEAGAETPRSITGGGSGGGHAVESRGVM